MIPRISLILVLYEYKTGCNFDHGAMGTKQWSTSYPVLLKQAGNRIANIGKFGFGVDDNKNFDKRGIEGTGFKDIFGLHLRKHEQKRSSNR
ncbi:MULTISPECIES: hypothetical protein [unclassified Lentimonas]|uniref:hypothetical protein n=1 Tax=unclassified Lentimonas TaxID=2630993 RepID=UPI0013255F9B|nr:MULTISPECIES: hypothetical protein [unclassified Lentimonas]CAA6692427.1 Unannotated [Lentimonas sp. CC19]CAA6694033.1 Unannotated [Lentimonas sp. CC10]CAA7072245.1 Unannotated [Lentimonas sp. CC11]